AQENLLANFNQKNWKSDIFKSTRLATIAMALYLDKKIDVNQLYTVLQYIEIGKIAARHNILAYPLLDENGIVSEKFIQRMTTTYNLYSHSEFGSRNALLHNLQLLAPHIPISEQVYFEYPNTFFGVEDLALQLSS